jgi:hypothetical protein
MNRLLIACSLAAFCALTGAALAQTGSSMMSSQGSASQPVAGAQMAGPNNSQNMKTHKKSHATNANTMSGGNMSGPATAGAMATQSTNNTSSMSTPH